MGLNKRTLLILLVTVMVFTGFCITPVTAKTTKQVPIIAMAAPVMICGVEVSFEAAIVIAGVLGMVTVKEALKNHQAEWHENIRKVADEFASWLSALKGCVYADSKEAQKLFKTEATVYDHAPAGPDGKKPKKMRVYHEARVTEDGKNVEIKKEAMTKEEAIKLEKQMKKGEKKGIFSPNKKAADDLYEEITGKQPPKIPESHIEKGQSKQFPHYHTNKKHTSHLWWPKE